MADIVMDDLTPEPLAPDAPSESSMISAGAAILSLAAALLTVGAVMVFSTATQIEPSKNAPAWWASAAVKQTIFSLMALGVMIAISRIDYRFWRGRPDSAFQPTTWL